MAGITEEDYLDSLLRIADENAFKSEEDNTNEEDNTVEEGISVEEDNTAEADNAVEEYVSENETSDTEPEAEDEIPDIFKDIGDFQVDDIFNPEENENNDINDLTAALENIPVGGTETETDAATEEEAATDASEEETIDNNAIPLFDEAAEAEAENTSGSDDTLDFFNQLNNFDIFNNSEEKDADVYNDENDNDELDLLSAIDMLKGEEEDRGYTSDFGVVSDEAVAAAETKASNKKSSKNKMLSSKKEGKGFLNKVKDFLIEQGEDTEADIAAFEAKDAAKNEKKAKKAEKKEANKAARAEKKAADAEDKKVKAAERQSKKEQKRAEREEKAANEPKYIVTIAKVALLITIIAAFGILLWAVTDYNHRRLVNKNANSYFMSKQYELAYEEIADIRPDEIDTVLYEQIRTIMYVQKQYSSYLNFYNIDMKEEALNSLIKGVDKYDKYYENAVELGITADMDYVLDKIVTELNDTFGISLEKARALSNIEDSVEYSMELRKILKTY